MPRKAQGGLGLGYHPGVYPVRAGITGLGDVCSPGLLERHNILHSPPHMCTCFFVLGSQGGTVGGVTLLSLESLTAGRGPLCISSPLFQALCVLCPSWPGHLCDGHVGVPQLLGQSRGGSSEEEHPQGRRGHASRWGASGSRCRLLGEEWTTGAVMLVRKEAWGQLWLVGVSIQACGWRSHQRLWRWTRVSGDSRAFVRLAPFPTAAATFFGPFGQLSISPGPSPTCLRTGRDWAHHWAPGTDLAQETWTGRGPSRGPPLPTSHLPWGLFLCSGMTSTLPGHVHYLQGRYRWWVDANANPGPRNTGSWAGPENRLIRG